MSMFEQSIVNYFDKCVADNKANTKKKLDVVPIKISLIPFTGSQLNVELVDVSKDGMLVKWANAECYINPNAFARWKPFTDGK